MTNYIYHHGVIGMKWGVRRYQNPDGSLIKNGQTVFVSGSSKTQNKQSPYFRRKLPKQVKSNLKSHMKKNNRIIVGDAPGIDTQTQKYLNKKKYSNVTVYGPGKNVRYKANKNWDQRTVDSKYKEGSTEWLMAKDIAMTKAASVGLAVVLDEGSRATRKNVNRLVKQHKDVFVYQLSKLGKKHDKWV